MLNFKEFLSQLSPLGEGMYDDFDKDYTKYYANYQDWGFITPTGVVKRIPKGVKFKNGHEELATKLGYEGSEDAMRKGLVRFVVTKSDGMLEFQLRNDDKAKKATIKYLRNHAMGRVRVELFNRAFDHPLWTKDFDNPNIAATQLSNMVA